MRYFAHTPQTIDFMLNAINKKSLDDLFSTIPPAARFKKALALPKKLDELNLKRELSRRLEQESLTSFLGAGATQHFVPEWISQQLMRAEWYTSYTPYQPEASQGTLQAIFEFQSMVSSLLGLDVANASMYDGATALVEATLMAIRTTQRKTIILSETIHPEYRETVRTYLGFAGISCVEVPFDNTGATDLASLEALIATHQNDLAAVAIQSPNFFGRVEDTAKIGELAKSHGALFLGCVTDMTALALLPSFGSLGADIAVGEGLGFLGSLALGGPGVGLFSCKRSLLRQMPGRLVGETKDRNGKTGYVLTLSTREQHIRREKATSNICTNHNLMALAFSMTMASYGRTGFINLAKTNIKKTLYFRKCLERHGVTPTFVGPHFNETVIKVGTKTTCKKKLDALLEQRVVGGLSLGQFYQSLEGHVMVATTELHDDQAIEKLAHALCGARDE